MAAKKGDESKTEEKVKELEEKVKKLEEAQRETPDKDASGGVAGGILQSIGEMIPGLGGLIEKVSRSPAFQERLKKIDEELDRRLREEPLKRVGTEVTGGISRRPMGVPPGVRGRSAATPTARAKVKRRRPGQRLAAEAPEEISVDVFNEGSRIVVIAELAGVAEEDVEVKVQGQTLSIVVNTQGSERSREVELPCVVQGELQRSLSKGILRVQLEKAGTDD